MVIKRTRLANSLRLVTAPLKETKSVTIMVLVKVGSRYEDESNNGVSHFIEHLFFKGTKNRPSALLLSKELDSLGAEYNAFTTKDHTGYYVKVNSEKVNIAFELVSDMLLNSLFAAPEIEKERNVILEEINMYEDNPLFFVEDLFEKICFKGSSLSQLISGPKKNIKKISRREILNYKNKFYNPKNIVLGLAGDITENKALKLANRYFQSTGRQGAQQKLTPFKSNQQTPRLEIKYKDTEQVQIALGFPGYHNKDKRLMTLYLLSIILGGNMSSRLFTRIREENSLAYFIKSTINIFEDTGNFFIQAGLDRRRISTALKLIHNELEIIKSEGITDDELQRAKEFLKGKLILKLEESQALIQWLTEQMLLTSRIETLDDKINKIERVTANDIKKVANEIIDFNKINLAVIGPFKDEKIFKNLI